MSAALQKGMDAGVRSKAQRLSGQRIVLLGDTVSTG
jgi:hypothetical protein